MEKFINFLIQQRILTAWIIAIADWRSGLSSKKVNINEIFGENYIYLNNLFTALYSWTYSAKGHNFWSKINQKWDRMLTPKERNTYVEYNEWHMTWECVFMDWLRSKKKVPDFAVLISISYNEKITDIFRQANNEEFKSFGGPAGIIDIACSQPTLYSRNEHEWYDEWQKLSMEWADLYEKYHEVWE